MTHKLFLLLLVILFFLLAACATATAPAATSVTTFVAPDQSLATPIVGSVTVLKVPVAGAKGVFLRSRPDAKAPVAGEVQPGDSGKALGVDSSGIWVLVQIKDQTGWVTTQYLDYTIAQ